MPHKCMECKNLIESGTIDLQKGCPICGGKKFQYIRPRPDPDAKPTVAEYVASVELREPQFEAKESPVSRFPRRMSGETSGETSEETLPAVRPVKELAMAKKQEQQKLVKKVPEKAPADKLGDRIESIRIVEHGTYDINLPLLLNRKEFVTSKEEGNYTLDLNSVLKPGKKKKKKKQ
jgi:predicted  nucleic acid-binding Zn-ribbon protein